MADRPADALRPLLLRPHVLAHPEGSVLACFGATQVICTASVEERVPPWLQKSGRGWITAEYGMLPRSTHTRNAREAVRGRPSGRSQEISRLIGRSLRAAVPLTALGERTVAIDCDVLQADGGTRTAAITGGYVALALALRGLMDRGKVAAGARIQPVAAISVGIVDGVAQLDLDYAMDARAEVDLNVVMAGDGQLVEVQGTGENATFSRDQLVAMVDLATGALPALRAAQEAALAAAPDATAGPLGLPARPT